MTPHNVVLTIRTDAGPATGFGHLMRCLAVAQEWVRRGGEVYLVSSTLTPDAKKKAENVGIIVRKINAEAGSRKDAIETSAICRSVGAQWVLVDGYSFNETFQEEMFRRGARMAIIDDFGHSQWYYGDLILNQNVYARDSDYCNKCQPFTKILAGPKYALLRDEFRVMKTKPVQNHTSLNCLITFGGSDPDNVTRTVIRSLESDEFSSVHFFIVINTTNPHYGELIREFGNKDPHFSLISDPPDMAEIMAGSDFAISGAGITALELVFLEIPLILIALAENQQRVANTLHAKKCAVSLGTSGGITPNQIHAAAASFLTEKNRSRISRRCHSIIDGKGANRFVDFLTNAGIVLKKWTKEDCRKIWYWINEPETRKNSFSQKKIGWLEHSTWFSQKIQDSRHIGFIIYTNAGKPIGSVRFATSKNAADISVMIASRFRKKGYGRAAIYSACHEIFTTTSVTSINSYIRPENITSVRSFANAGFIPEGNVQKNGSPAIWMKLEKVVNS